ncbi:MAG TPA: TIGR03435 family protein [Bryobacteraceae bacterium]|jgi:uncharacterized protein (TIGR03435 family)|nr:TIGR03435 family protein [Bryobacteraceae bacterium]
MRTIAALLVAISAAAQIPEASPRFEVASIKPSPPGAPSTGRIRIGSRGGPGTDDPGLFTCERCSLTGLIRQAFQLQDYQISAPDWLPSWRFNISAKIPEGATKEQFRLMMRNLLIDRFKLQFHFEKKETQTYALVIAKNGPKIKESPGPVDRDERPGRLTERKLDADGFVILPPGRVSMMMIMSDGHATERHAEETMQQFAESLVAQVNHPVTDATGLKGKYDFTLRWISQDAGPSGDDAGPNLFRALEEQLGLKLEAKKGTIDSFVVDHLEKAPTEN